MHCLSSAQPSRSPAARCSAASLPYPVGTKGGCIMKVLFKRPLGRSGLHITQVGFGAWAIGGGGWGFGWGKQDDADSIAAIRHPVGRGIKWIHTPANYRRRPSPGGGGPALRVSPAPARPHVLTQ